jgi:hypothetical protein
LRSVENPRAGIPPSGLPLNTSAEEEDKEKYPSASLIVHAVRRENVLSANVRLAASGLAKEIDAMM